MQVELTGLRYLKHVDFDIFTNQRIQFNIAHRTKIRSFRTQTTLAPLLMFYAERVIFRGKQTVMRHYCQGTQTDMDDFQPSNGWWVKGLGHGYG